MMTQKQQRILVWSAVVLLVLNITTLATIAFQAIQDNTISKSEQLEKDEKAGDSSEKISGRYFRDKLAFTSEQMNSFSKINQRFRSEAVSIQVQLSDIRRNMLEEMSAEKSDTSKLNNLSEELGSLHARLKVISYQYYLDIKALCNSDQKIKLKEIFKTFFDTENPIGNPGPGRYRRGQGWRNNSNNNN